MGIPRLGLVQEILNAEGCVEVYFRDRDTGWRIRRSELEQVLNTKENKLTNQEFHTILGVSCWVNGEEITLVLDYPPEIQRKLWQEELAEAQHEITSGG